MKKRIDKAYRDRHLYAENGMSHTKVHGDADADSAAASRTDRPH